MVVGLMVVHWAVGVDQRGLLCVDFITKGTIDCFRVCKSSPSVTHLGHPSLNMLALVLVISIAMKEVASFE